MPTQKNRFNSKECLNAMAEPFNSELSDKIVDLLVRVDKEFSEIAIKNGLVRVICYRNCRYGAIISGNWYCSHKKVIHEAKTIIDEYK